MTNGKQIEANRRNAQRSTGPRTDRGKAIVARNALRHGLTAQRILLPDETQDELGRLVDLLRRHYQPVGAAEVLLLERIIAATWRLRRVYRIEAGILSWQYHRELSERAESEAEGCRRHSDQYLLDAMYSVTDETKRREALDRAASAAAKRDAEDTALGVAFVRDAAGANALPKLSRYEASIERGMCRAIQELERLQAARRRSDAPEADGGSFRVLDGG